MVKHFPLYFPTRYFPAISGGDLFIMRTAKVTGNSNKEQYGIITSNAIDFAGLKGNGLFLNEGQKYYSEVHGVRIIRLNTKDIGDPNIEPQQNDSDLFERFVSDLDFHSHSFSETTFKYFFENGPIFDLQGKHLMEMLDSQVKATYQRDLSSVSYILCSYLPYSNLLYSLSVGEKLNIPTFCTPFLHPENSRYNYQAIYDILNGFTGLHACTEFEKEMIVSQGYDSKRITVIPMAVDFEKFRYDPTQTDNFLKNYNIDVPFVLFSGYKNYEKGALSLLNALRALFERGVNVGAVLIGPPTKAFNAEWKKLLSDFPRACLVNLTPSNLGGYFDYKKIAAFNGCLCYCMVSRSEAYGISYLESWACSKPVIAADIPAMREVVRDGIDGFLVEFNNIQAMADKIEFLYTHSDKAGEMGKEGYKKIINKNTWFNISKELRKFIEEVGEL